MAKAHIYEPRLCHVTKRDDFDGYGFNLHAEKGRPGQYIGKVDDGSPAETAGLKQGDRIIEVNGSNIGSETHKQVVERIKAITDSTKLLVIDPKADIHDHEQLMVIDKFKANLTVISVTTNGTTNNTSNNNSNNNNNMTTTNNNNTTTSTVTKNGISNTNGNVMSSSNDANQELNSTTPTTTTPTSTATVTPVTSNGNASNGTVTSNGTSSNLDDSIKSTTSSASSNGGTTTGGLNLHMTAAEMRAQLKSKKRIDPKTESLDVRKKYDIIQKM